MVESGLLSPPQETQTLPISAFGLAPLLKILGTPLVSLMLCTQLLLGQASV